MVYLKSRRNFTDKSLINKSANPAAIMFTVFSQQYL